MSVPLRRNIGLYETLAGLPEGLTGEILDGQIQTQPRPTGRHAHAESVLGMRLGPPYRFGEGGPGGWWILIEPEVHFVRDTEVAVPDLAGWRRERLPSIPEDQRFLVAPDWVCEILSPGSRSKDREIKMPLYARHGVRHAWLVDPRERTLEAYALCDAHWAPLGFYRDDESACVAPFDAVTLRLTDLWV